MATLMYIYFATVYFLESHVLPFPKANHMNHLIYIFLKLDH